MTVPRKFARSIAPSATFECTGGFKAAYNAIMALKVRLRHAGGERVFEIPFRSSEKPLIIGQGDGANIKLASEGVLPRHCFLFVHHEQWVVHDYSGGATLLNGTALTKPTRLSIGDIITIGGDASAATLEIEPQRAAAGEAKAPATERGVASAPPNSNAAAPVVAAAVVPIASPVSPGAHAIPRAEAVAAMPGSSPSRSTSTVGPLIPAVAPVTPAAAPAIPAASRAVPASAPLLPTALPLIPTATAVVPTERAAIPTATRVIPTATPVIPTAAPVIPTAAPVIPTATTVGAPLPAIPTASPLDGEEGDDTIGWAAAAGASHIPRARQRKTKRTSGAGVAVGMLLVLGIVAGSAYVIYQHRQPPVQVIELSGPVKPKVTPATRPAPPTQPAAAEQQIAAMREPTRSDAAQPADSDDNPAADPHAGDPEWLDVQVAHDMENQAPALLRYTDYARRNPGKNAALLKQYEQDALDRIWWKRVTQLWKQRAQLTQDLAAKNKEISEEGKTDFAANLIGERNAMQAQLQEADHELRVDMEFNLDALPDFTDETSAAAARARRNPRKFAAWAKTTAQYIRDHAGQTPWGND